MRSRGAQPQRARAPRAPLWCRRPSGASLAGAGWEDGKGDEEGFALRSWLHIMHSVSFSMIPFTLLGHAVVKR